MLIQRNCFKIILWLYIAHIFTFCGKGTPTSVDGLVVDKVTGKPIERASIGLTFGQNSEGKYPYYYVYSDAEGRFSYESHEDFGFRDAYKEGYLPKCPGIKDVQITQNTMNEVTIKMVPYDGILRLKIENIAGQHDSIFVGAYSAILASEAFFSHGYYSFNKPSLPFVIGNQYSQDIPVVSEENIKIIWGFSVNNYPFQSLVKVGRNDTTSYTISF